MDIIDGKRSIQKCLVIQDGIGITSGLEIRVISRVAALKDV